MLFFGVGKDPLNGFLALRVKLLVFRSIPGIVGQFFIVLPDVAQDGLYAVFGAGTKLAGGTLGADFCKEFLAAKKSIAKQAGQQVYFAKPAGERVPYQLSNNAQVYTLCLSLSKNGLSGSLPDRP